MQNSIQIGMDGFDAKNVQHYELPAGAKILKGNLE
jgi:hypothetical protein